MSAASPSPSRTDLLVTGYVRQSANRYSLYIPASIQSLIMVNYWIKEKWTVHGSAIELDAMNAQNIQRRGVYNTVYGNHVVDLGDTSIAAYSWSFRFQSYNNEDDFRFRFEPRPIKIGITCTSKHGHTDFAEGNGNIHYAFSTNGRKYRYPALRRTDQRMGSFFDGADIVDRPVVHLVLNVVRKELIYQNGDDDVDYKQLIHKKVQLEQNKRWNLAVSMACYQDDIELIDFVITHK